MQAEPAAAASSRAAGWSLDCCRPRLRTAKETGPGEAPAALCAGCFSRARGHPATCRRENHSPAAFEMRTFPSLVPQLGTHLSEFSDLFILQLDTAPPPPQRNPSKALLKQVHTGLAVMNLPQAGSPTLATSGSSALQFAEVCKALNPAELSSPILPSHTENRRT